MTRATRCAWCEAPITPWNPLRLYCDQQCAQTARMARYKIATLSRTLHTPNRGTLRA